MALGAVVTPSTITANAGDVTALSCTASGGTFGVGDFSKAEVSGYEQTRCFATLANGNIVVGVGYTGGAKVYVSTDDFATSPSVLYDYSSLGREYVGAIVAVGNDIVVSTISETANDVKIYKNNTLAWSSPVGKVCYVSLCAIKMDNGNIMFAVGGGYGDTDNSYAAVLLSTDNGASFTQVLSPTPLNNPYQYRMLSLCAVSATRVLASDANGKIYYSDNSGGTWAAGVSPHPLASATWCSIATVPNGDVITYSSSNGTWYVSSDDGGSWSIWGQQPLKHPYVSYYSDSDVTAFCSRTDNYFAYYLGGIWYYKQFGIGVVESTAAVPLRKGSSFFVGAGYDAGDGDIWKATFSAGYSYSWLLNGVQVGTLSALNYTADIDDDGDTLTCKTTDGVSTVYSNVLYTNTRHDDPPTVGY